MNRQEAFTLAIQNEIQSQNLYDMLAKSFKNPESATMFYSLIPLEKIHEEKLRAAFSREFPNETLQIDNELLPFVKIGNITEPKQVLDFAISREEAAAEAYHILATESVNPDMKQMLMVLAQEEENHRDLLLSEIQRMQGAAIWFDPSELSGLMED